MTLIVNLNGNVFCPFQIFIDILAQHSPSPQLLPKSNALVFAPLCELEAINDWINLESLGKPAALRAQWLANNLYNHLSSQGVHNLELHIVCSEGIVTSDNLYLLLFLARQYPQLSLSFYVTEEKKARLQQNLDSLKETSAVINILDLECCSPFQRQLSSLEDNRNKLLASKGFPLEHLVLHDGVGPLLTGYAWMCLKAGAAEVGSGLLTNVLAHNVFAEGEQEKLFMTLQLVRFLSHHYEEVVLEPFPKAFKTLAAADEISLYFIKAYCATLTRHLDIAEQCFQRCQIDETMPPDDENALYRLNLFALFKALKGQMQTAFDLELLIESFIKAHQITITGLKYVNFINIARLHKKNADWANALTYYKKAYQEIGGGGYTASDRIYYHINHGSLQEAAGNQESAFFYWVGAALHWLAFDNKYALSWRPRLILCQEKMNDILKPLSISKVNQFLFDKLSQLITATGMILDNTDSSPMQFAYADTLKSYEACYLFYNAILYGSDKKPPAYADKLTVLVSQIIRHKGQIGDHSTFIIDTHHDELYPQTDAQSWLFAKLAQCKACYRENRWLPLDASKVQPLWNRTIIRLAPSLLKATPNVKGMALHYRRSFLNKQLTEKQEIAMVHRLLAENKVALSQVEPGLLAELLKKKIVVMEFPVSHSKAAALI